VLAIRLLYFTKGLSFSSGAEGLSSAPVGYVSSTRVSCGAPTSASWGTPGLRVEAIKGVEACQTPGYGAVLCSFCSRERKIPVLLPLPSAAGHVLRPGNASARNGRMAPVHGKYMVPRFSGGSVADFGRFRGGFRAAPWRISGSAAAFSGCVTALLGGATASMGSAPGHRTAEGCVVRPPLRRT